MPRFIVAVVSAAVLLSSLAAHATLPDPVTNAMRDVGVPVNTPSIYVREVGKIEPLVAHRSTVPMNPASTMKIVTTLVGLDVLTPNYTWKTTFSTTSRIEGGVLRGPLYLRGSGDPKFVAEHLQTAIKSLRDRGIREIAGDILLDRTRFAGAAYDPSQFDEPIFNKDSYL